MVSAGGCLPKRLTMTTDPTEARKKAEAVLRGSAVPGETVFTSMPDLARIVLELADEVERLRRPLDEQLMGGTPDEIGESGP
jgi:hypothetical protein